MNVKQTEEDTNHIINFLKVIKQELRELATQGKNIQEIFEQIELNIKDSQGTMYLCFSCASIQKRKDMQRQRFYQISGVWHICDKTVSHNGLSTPTVGLFTRFSIIKKYLVSIGFIKSLENVNI